MIAGVADTHAALWFLFGDLRLSTTAKDFFDKAAAARHKIVLSPISLGAIETREHQVTREAVLGELPSG